MQHLTTRAPATLNLAASPSPIMGWIATANDVTTGRTVEAWGPTELEARQRAEYLVQLKGAA